MKIKNTLWVGFFFLLFSSLSYGQNTWKIDQESTSVIQKTISSVVSIYLIPEKEKSVITEKNSIYGSGVIVHSEGLVLTSLQLVNRRGYKIILFLTTGKRYQAKIIGRSLRYGIALLKIQANNLPSIAIGDSSTVRAGSIIFKFGNAFQTARDYLPAVNLGTICALDSIGGMGELMRFDSGVNMGDHGGPIVDIQGKLVGIMLPSWIHPTTNTYTSYAVPVNLFKKMLPEMKGYLGILLTVTSQGTEGALVEAVDPQGPASKASIQVGDRIVSFGNKRIQNPKELVAQLQKYVAGNQVPVVIVRNNRSIRTSVIIGIKTTD